MDGTENKQDGKPQAADNGRPGQLLRGRCNVGGGRRRAWGCNGCIRIKQPDDLGSAIPDATGEVAGLEGGQDRRFDLPAIGRQTVENVARAGLAGLAVAAGSAIIAEIAEVIAAADRARVFLVGVGEGAGQ